MLFYLLIDLLMPTFMIFMGIIFKIKTPKYPKKAFPLFGYRTNRSLNSKESWDFAHKWGSKYWLSFGIFFGIIVSINRFLSIVGNDMDTLTIINIGIGFIGFIAFRYRSFYHFKALILMIHQHNPIL